MRRDSGALELQHRREANRTPDREALEALREQFDSWLAHDRTTLGSIGGASVESEFGDLCLVLNWSEEEARREEAALAAILAGRVDLHGDLFTGMIGVLRKIAAEVVRAEPGPQEQDLRTSSDKWQLPLWEAFAGLEVTDADLARLEALANERAQFFRLMRLPGPGLYAASGYWVHTSRLVWAARGLWPVLEGKAKLLRCPAPAPGHSDPAIHCGRYLVAGGRVGRPARFCSDTCRRRAAKVGGKVAQRQGGDEITRT